MSTETVQKRVAAGAAMLDREMPGWHAEVDVTVLDAAHQSRCVLGQLFGRYAFAPVDGLAAVAHGFKAMSADEVAALTGEWRRAIEARRVDAALTGVSTDRIESGDPIEVRDVIGAWLAAVARSGVEPTHRDGRKIHDFAVVWVAMPGVAEPMPWPATDVRPYIHDEDGAR